MLRPQCTALYICLHAPQAAQEGTAAATSCMPAKQMPCRGLLGDNPDISKAMRLLTASGKLVKTGRGGRVTPFFYHVRRSHTAAGPVLQSASQC